MTAVTAIATVLLWLLILAAVIAAYWAPTAIAWQRHTPNLPQVAIVNGLLGWTFVGWAVALAMAFTATPPGPPPVRPA